MRLFALVFVLASSALAQPIRSLHDDQWVHTRVSLLGGVATRGLVQSPQEIATSVNAGSLHSQLEKEHHTVAINFQNAE